MPQSKGTKVTDPHATINEPTGLVTSDSLAAESLAKDGSFAANNPHAAASNQPSKSTTSNTKDTSGATRLPPAPDAEARDAQHGWQETSQLNAGQGLGSSSSSGGGGGSGSGSGGSGGRSGGGSGGSGRSGDGAQGRPAPTGAYAGSAEPARSHGEFKPHGTNITEDPGLTGKTVFGKIGTQQDPGRVAELEFAKRDAMPGDAPSRGSDGQRGDNQFGGLNDERV